MKHALNFTFPGQIFNLKKYGHNKIPSFTGVISANLKIVNLSIEI
jgi:hypothetical protein